MSRVRAAFLVTVDVDVDDYAYFVSRADAGVISPEKAQSWLSQDYFDRIDDGIEVGDRPESLSWSVDTVVNIDEVADLVSKSWALSDHIHGHDEFREFARGYRDFL